MPRMAPIAPECPPPAATQAPARPPITIRAINPRAAVRLGVLGSLPATSSSAAARRKTTRAGMLPIQLSPGPGFSHPRCVPSATAAGAVRERSPVRTPIRSARTGITTSTPPPLHVARPRIDAEDDWSLRPCGRSSALDLDHLETGAATRLGCAMVRRHEGQVQPRGDHDQRGGEVDGVERAKPVRRQQPASALDDLVHDGYELPGCVVRFDPAEKASLLRHGNRRGPSGGAHLDLA